MAIGANTGSRGSGSPHSGGHPAASPTRPAHPAIGPSGGGGPATAYGAGRSRLAGGAPGLGGAGDHLGASIHTGGPKRPAGAPADPGVRHDDRARGLLRKDEPVRGLVGHGRWGAPLRRFGGPDHYIGHPDHWRGGIRPGLVGRWPWFHPGHRWPWLYRADWVEGGVPSQTVMWAQACLSQLLGTELPQDGFFGPDTQQAIASFQAQHNLPPGGTLDDNTVSALQATCAREQEGAYGGEPGEYEEFGDTFEERDIAGVGDTTKTIVRYDDSYAVYAADGTRIPLPMWRGKWVKFPVVVTVTLPRHGVDWYTAVIMPKPYSGFIDKWTDKLFNSPALLKLASQSLPRSAGLAMFGVYGAIAGAVIGTLFTPRDISREAKLDATLDGGKRVVYWVLCEFQGTNPPLGSASAPPLWS
jgi:hypothetical protein